MRWLAMALTCVAMISAAGHAMGSDPFDDARYYVGVKQTAKVIELIDSGQFDVNQQNEEGYTLLHFAAEAGDMTVVKALLARGANPNIKSKSGDRKSVV